LAVAGRIAPPGSPTVILAEAGGVSPEGISFGVILHGREGLLSELEVYPKGDAVRRSDPVSGLLSDAGVHLSGMRRIGIGGQ